MGYVQRMIGWGRRSRETMRQCLVSTLKGRDVVVSEVVSRDEMDETVNRIEDLVISA